MQMPISSFLLQKFPSLALVSQWLCQHSSLGQAKKKEMINKDNGYTL